MISLLSIFVRGGGGVHLPHIMVGMCHRKVKNGGGGSGRTSSSEKMGVSRTNIGHSGTNFVGIRGGGGSLELDIVKNVHALPMDGHVAGTLAGRGRRWTVKCHLVMAWTENYFENDGLRSGKSVKLVW